MFESRRRGKTSKYDEQYLTIEFLENGTFYHDPNGNFYWQKSDDGGITWRDIPGHGNTYSGSDNYQYAGDVLQIKYVATSNTSYIGSFAGTAVYNIYGNVMSLLYGDDFIGKTEFPNGSVTLASLFASTNIVDASNLILPIKTINRGGYASMFYECTLLEKAPELPATRLNSHDGYRGMFEQCTSLKEAPELPATSISYSSYARMFMDCSSLIKAPSILPVTYLSEDCYDSMFYGCTSLTTAPELPATELCDGCYHYMFYGCQSLNYIKMNGLYFNYTSQHPLESWTYNVPSTGTFVKNPDLVQIPNTQGLYGSYGSYGIPEYWDIINSDGSKPDYNYKGYFNIQLQDWQESSAPNPDSNWYTNVYESDNAGYPDSYSTMYININGYDTFKLYIRSNGESYHDYVMVSQLDASIDNNTAYDNVSLVKAHTRGKPNSGTTINDYTLVTFDNIGGGSHKIAIIYRKDSSADNGDDKGYVLIPQRK